MWYIVVHVLGVVPEFVLVLVLGVVPVCVNHIGLVLMPSQFIFFIVMYQ